MRRSLASLLLLCLLPFGRLHADSCDGATQYRVGAGIYDITGPPGDVTMMGYAMPFQRTAGIHTRLYSRAFVIESPCNGKRVALVTADLGLVPLAVKQDVIRQLSQRFGEMYRDENVVIAATHTHSGPGGYSHYFIYDLTVLGFSAENFRAVADGIVQSIVRAHDNIVESRVTSAAGELLDTNINRSLPAYLRNPAGERARYPHDADKRMTLLRFDTIDGAEVGILNWFPVHATSMGNTNRLICSDNKGHAALSFERWKKADRRAAKTFVAAFANANEGDTSPNIFGGEDGGGGDDFESVRISGEKQFYKARELYESPRDAVTGPVDYRHAFVKMDGMIISPARTDGGEHVTCPAAIGFSMLAGAEDGTGIGKEGLACNSDTPEQYRWLCGMLTTPCQAEKPIVLEMGTRQPIPWSPEVLPLQIVRIGSLAVVAVPFELTTMAGRRIRETVDAQLRAVGVREVVFSGLSNAYAGYVSTREEYVVQHYEGASTHFGPWTLAALQDRFDGLARALAIGEAVDPGPTPRNLNDENGTLLDPVLYDEVPAGNRFGEVVEQPEPTVRPGAVARATFWAGHPNNDLQIQDTYIEVQRKQGDSWGSAFSDADPETKFIWERVACGVSIFCSHATAEWRIPAGTLPGTYRLRHDGKWKAKETGVLTAYEGVSRDFEVTAE